MDANQVGAEATVSFANDTVRKERLAKSYRLPALDARLRKQRTLREAKVLAAAPVRVPIVLAVEDTTLVLERIHGERLRDVLKAENAAHYGRAFGTMLAALHAADLTHGDLTTSNILVETATNELVLIDFGLATFTKRLEDKAVDLHVLKETLSGSHPLLAETFWHAFSKTYSAAQPDILARLSAVETRGRYKKKH